MTASGVFLMVFVQALDMKCLEEERDHADQRLESDGNQQEPFWQVLEMEALK